MHKIKTSLYYLERGFPENLEPAFTNKSTKRKRFLVERRNKILKRAIRKSLQTLVKPFFSAPTKKGFLLEKSETGFQNLFQQEKVGNFHKEPAYCLPTSLASQKLTCRLNQVKQDGVSLPVEDRPSLPVEATLQSPAYKKQDWKQERLGGKCKRYKFVFPLHRLKGELSKRESQYGKIELYKKQIQEKKKLAFLYGSQSKNSLKKLVKRARNLSSLETPPVKGLVLLLESRLDVVLFRASFFSSISMARQWISHNKVVVNKKKVRAPSYQLKGGDCIEILSASAFPLKERIRQRLTRILPFRRSRKKLITSSLMENWCSFEKLFPKEGGMSFPVSRSQEKKDLFASPVVTQNFSLIKDHLQSMWEKSVQSQQSKRRGQGGDENPLTMHLKSKCQEKGSLFSWTADSFSQSGPLFTKNRERGAISSTTIHSALQRGVALFGRLKKKQVETLRASDFRREHIPSANSGSVTMARDNCHKAEQMHSGKRTLDFLRGKQALVQPRNRMQKLAGLQVSAIKPLHLEVSYKLLTTIFLYSPQKVAYPCNLDLPLIMRSFK